MKKTLYLLAFIAVAFASCDPLSKTYQNIDAVKAATPQTITLNVTTSYASPTAASTGIVTTLNTSYSTVPDGSSAAVTYVAPANSTFAPSVTLSAVAYTMVSTDYTFPGNTFSDLSDAAVLNFLAYKYPTPVANQQVVLTYNYFLSGYTASSGTITTDSFVFAGGAWVKCYTVSPNQYATVNRGLTNTFVSADVANIPTYLAGFLKADGAVSIAAKAGDVKYVSYRYATTSNYILPMYYNGTVWASTPTLLFLKVNGTWIPDPTVYYKLSTADTKLIGNSTFGTAAQRTNLSSYGDFSGWATADIQGGIIVVLTADFPTPKANVPYKVTYLNYTGGVDVPTVLTFVYNGTAWAAQ